MDDGWWEGELDGQKGYFPSLVVELCDENGELFSEEEEEEDHESPDAPAPAPPACAPPKGPADKNFLFDGIVADITVTQPTPCTERPAADDFQGKYSKNHGKIFFNK